MAQVTLTLSFCDGVDGSSLDPAAIDSIELDPPPLSAEGPNVFIVEGGRPYRASVRPKRGLYRPADAEFDVADEGDAGARVALPRRATVLYVTIDDRRDLGHAQNVAGLRAAAEASQLGLEVRQVWFGDVRDQSADDFDAAGTFLFFFAGSYTEWHEYGSNRDWRDLLDRLGALLRDTDVPAIAVCGSHQLLARSFGDDWHAVAHMAPAGAAPTPIAAELATSPPRDLIPSPRLGEVGVFPLRPTAAGARDPLLLGLQGRALYFTESHYDQALAAGLSPQFVPLLEPDRGAEAVAVVPVGPHDRCAVQALRYAGARHRLLYSCQFHPECVTHASFTVAQREQADRLGNDGLQVLLNLLESARAFWEGLPAANA